LNNLETRLPEATETFDSEGFVLSKFTISQIIDAKNVFANDDDVWITKTADFADDQVVTTRGILIPAGTRRTSQRRRTDTKGGRYAEIAGAERNLRRGAMCYDEGVSGSAGESLPLLRQNGLSSRIWRAI
jgi:hypothetical protein